MDREKSTQWDTRWLKIDPKKDSRLTWSQERGYDPAVNSAVFEPANSYPCPAMATDVGGIMEALQQQTGLMHSMMQGMSAMLERMTKQEAGQDESAKKSKCGQLGGKLLEKMKKFTGGEEEWVEWSDEFRMYIDIQTPQLAKVMKHVETHGEKSIRR